jgi:hypothetical protein
MSQLPVPGVRCDLPPVPSASVKLLVPNELCHPRCGHGISRYTRDEEILRAREFRWDWDRA